MVEDRGENWPGKSLFCALKYLLLVGGTTAQMILQLFGKNIAEFKEI